jgi:ribosomal protein S8
MDKDMITSVVEFVGVTGDLINGYQQKIASVEKELADARALAKEAAVKETVKPETFEAKAIAATVVNMANAGFIKKAEQERTVAQITADPSVLLSYLNKLAEREVSVVKPMARVSTGQAQAPTMRESDRVFEDTFKSLSRKI